MPERKPHIILIGHRGSGKTTLGTLAASALALSFTDIDSEIESKTSRTAADWVEHDEPGFRSLEVRTLLEVAASNDTGIISCGAGLHISEAFKQTFDRPVLWIWIQRDGWEQSAAALRKRLKPDLPFSDEYRWMVETREPVFAMYADAKLHIEYGCNEESAAHRLLAIINSLCSTLQSQNFKHSWIVPQNNEEILKAERLATLFPIAGLEIRSDFETTTHLPNLPYITSLRTADQSFLRRHAEAAAFDMDIQYFDHSLLGSFRPRPLVISSHPQSVDPAITDGFVNALDLLDVDAPQWLEHTGFKYAPYVQSWEQLSEALSVAHDLRRILKERTGSIHFTFLPQGHKWRWMRALLLHENAMNYLALPGLEQDKLPPSLSYFLPFAAAKKSHRFYAVIGDPVDQSIGDVWHMERNIAAGLFDTAYYKINVSKNELDAALAIIHALNFEGLSVTAPLKRAVAESAVIENPLDLEAGNTLSRTTNGWRLDDSDEKGMDAVLTAIAKQGILAGTAAVYGAGGVSPSVIRSLQRNGWTVLHVSARDGWSGVAEREVDLIVNAAGPGVAVFDGAPSSNAWIDLHYSSNTAPESVNVYVNGMIFYEAQASEQREIWGLR
jgi:shikimate kinase